MKYFSILIFLLFTSCEKIENLAKGSGSASNDVVEVFPEAEEVFPEEEEVFNGRPQRKPKASRGPMPSYIDEISGVLKDEISSKNKKFKLKYIGDVRTNDGRVYKGVIIKKWLPKGVKASVRGALSVNISFADLPDKERAKFDYNQDMFEKMSEFQSWRNGTYVPRELLNPSF